MTCREKLALEHPACISDAFMGGCSSCPKTYGYLDYSDDCNVTEESCRRCWDREIPGTESLTYEHSGEPIGKVTDITMDENGVTATIVPINSHHVQNEKEKEKNMTTTKKTKAELLEELDNVKNAKAELEKELKNLEKYKQYEDAAGEVHALYTSFVMAGFTEDQAFELLKAMMQNAGQINFNASIKPSYTGYRCNK